MMRVGKRALTLRGKQLVNANGEGTLAHTYRYGPRGSMPFRPQPSCPAKAGNPVRRDSSVSRHRLWNTGSPAYAGDDTECVARTSVQKKEAGVLTRPFCSQTFHLALT